MSLALPHAHARQLAALRAAAPETRAVLVGAVALMHHLPLGRSTQDVDLALALEEGGISSVLASLGWTRDRFVAHRWNASEGFRADVLPASAAAMRAGSVRMDAGHREMSLIGFDLAFAHAEEVGLPGTPGAFPVASLSSLVVLKIVSFLDRPRIRTKDLGDLAIVLRSALPEDDDRRWELPLRQVEFGLQSAWSVGHEVGTICEAGHRERIDRFLTLVLAEHGEDWAMTSVREARLTGAEADEEVRAWWRAFQSGFGA